MGVWEDEDALGYYDSDPRDAESLIPGLATAEARAIENAAIHAHAGRHTLARAWRIEGGYGGTEDN